MCTEVILTVLHITLVYMAPDTGRQIANQIIILITIS